MPRARLATLVLAALAVAVQCMMAGTRDARVVDPALSERP